jgi:hypothetical protein
MTGRERLTTRVPAIISVSRRTDVPRFYAEWWQNRIRAGYVLYSNSFGGLFRTSLAHADVLAYLLWTRDALPALGVVRSLLDDGIPCAAHQTINQYDADLEPGRPTLDQSVQSLRALASAVPPGAVQWRYDPIILMPRYDTAWHVAMFSSIAQRLEGLTRVVNVSVCEPYVHTVRRLPTLDVQLRRADPERHRGTMKSYPSLGVATCAPELVTTLAAIATQHGIVLRSCSNPELPVAKSQCCGPELFAGYGSAVIDRLAGLKRAPTRPSCSCLASADIGMSDTCPAGCPYCYVVHSQQASERAFERHDPTAESLR